ncbi:FAD-dependent oxidoreductase [Atribacter sp.]|uniref:oxidoreductase n=1 Tax=Atribacter sp. TaxID=2847780 RepID=UPI00345E552E
MEKFHHLFQPIMVGKIEIPNRICHVPTDISSSHIDGSVTERDIHHYATIAKGGTGFIIVGATSVDGKNGRSTVTNLVADEDYFIPGLARLADSMHRYGSKCAVQLQHPGRQAALPREGKITSNDMVVSLPWSQSRTIVYANADESKKTVRVLSTDEIIGLIDLFSEAAWRVKQAGFDAVELHAAHGYLLSQFMSPYLNKRTDRFGGSFENRLRLPLAIVDSIQKKCGKDFPVLIRYSVDEWVPGGRDLTESIAVAKEFEQAGVAALNLSQCIQERPGAGFDPMYYPEGWTIYASEAIKKQVKIPVINSHSLRNPDYCEQIVAEGKTDLVGLSRQLLADPYWPLKAKYGKTRTIRRCISCLTGCWSDSILAKKEVTCAINPSCNNHHLEIKKKTTAPVHIAVVGGGPAGLEAARVAHERGHFVTLFEKSGELGGAILGCCLVNGKEKMKWYADWIRYQIADLGIQVQLRTSPTIEDLSSFDLVINATGAQSYVPDVHGLKEVVIPFERVMACPKVACEFHPQDRKSLPLKGTKIILWGDHYAAADTAAYLASIGKEVALITDQKEFGSKIEVIHKYVLFKRFQQTDAEALTSKPYKYPVKIYNQSTIDEITEHELILMDKNFQKMSLPYDHIISCWTRPNIELYEKIKAAAIPVVNIGDSVEPRNLHAAVKEGTTIGLNIEKNILLNPNQKPVSDLPLDVAGQFSRA